MSIRVGATEEDVLTTLRGRLSADEFSLIRVKHDDGEDDSPELVPNPRRAEPITTGSILIWVLSGVAGNLAYDGVKALSKKVRDILADRFGEDRVDDVHEGEDE